MSLYRRPSSRRFWCRFQVGGRTIRISTGTTDRAQAEEFETALRARYWREAKLGETFHTLSQAGERWLKETEKRTKAKDEGIIKWFIENSGNPPLRAIDRTVIDAARAKLLEGLGKVTVNYYLGVLRSIMRKARDEWGWLESVPKFPMYRRELGEPRWLTRKQFKTLVKLLPPHSADLARVAVATGLRKSNITGLTWDRVDLRRATAYIPGPQAKAGRGIPVALNSDAVRVIKRWKGKHATHVFSYQGEPIKYVVTKAWRTACNRAGAPGFRFHELRHTWASWQIQAETPLSVLQEMGGWASYEMVRRYAHLSPGHLRAYADRVLVTPAAHKRKKRA